jgi:hypothetical protein
MLNSLLSITVFTLNSFTTNQSAKVNRFANSREILNEITFAQIRQLKTRTVKFPTRNFSSVSATT